MRIDLKDIAENVLTVTHAVSIPRRVNTPHFRKLFAPFLDQARDRPSTSGSVMHTWKNPFFQNSKEVVRLSCGGSISWKSSNPTPLAVVRWAWRMRRKDSPKTFAACSPEYAPSRARTSNGGRNRTNPKTSWYHSMAWSRSETPTPTWLKARGYGMDGISRHRWLLAMKPILRKNDGQPVYQL
jgi:hypothetical protein